MKAIRWRTTFQMEKVRFACRPTRGTKCTTVILLGRTYNSLKNELGLIRRSRAKSCRFVRTKSWLKRTGSGGVMHRSVLPHAGIMHACTNCLGIHTSGQRPPGATRGPIVPSAPVASSGAAPAALQHVTLCTSM